MGCPKKFSVQGGMGAALMRNPDNAETIMRALVEKFGSKISVSCKIRVLKTFEDTLKYVLAMQATGIHWISIHPRTAAEESRVPARWFLTKTLLETGLIKIPVLGSGDLFSPLDVHKYLGFTKASGVILARGAIHNPEIFKLKEKILKTDIPMVETSEGVEAAEDWKDNCVEPEITDTSVALQEKEDEQIDSKKKGKASEYDEESIEFS
jgi:tRNA-dihydrouridine synthase 2